MIQNQLPGTPNHILIGKTRKFEKNVVGEFADTDLFLRKPQRTSQRIADHFWKRLSTEFLPTLTSRTKWVDNPLNMEIDDVVVIADKNENGNNQPLGKIEAVYQGRDRLVRVVDVSVFMCCYKSEKTLIK